MRPSRPHHAERLTTLSDRARVCLRGVIVVGFFVKARGLEYLVPLRQYLKEHVRGFSLWVRHLLNRTAIVPGVFAERR